MPLSQAVLETAKRVQEASARDASPRVRVIAGPGSGKSYVIEGRVAWLLSNGVKPEEIVATSFTRASALDLKLRIYAACKSQGISGYEKVQVRTLHSLALRILRSAGLLHYPSDPSVLDDWEVGQIFDSEYRLTANINIKRARTIREYREAFWYTGQERPANYIPADPHVSTAEINSFLNFHGPRTQTYCCVLPGEIVQQCVEFTRAGSLDPVSIVGASHLIVDEFQDLNPMDLEFIANFILGGITTFIAGDDDQSIYSFRYASPEGIQGFSSHYEGVGDHQLLQCFRCTPSILSSAKALIERNQNATRIPKELVSVYDTSDPRLDGILKLCTFRTDKNEAEAIAIACSQLIESGIPAREILILLSNGRALYPAIKKALIEKDVPFESSREEGFLDSNQGRFFLSVLRIVSNPNDYVAHRVLLGTLPGVGEKTLTELAEYCETNTQNYLKLFYDPLPHSELSGRAIKALNRAKQICATFKEWKKADEVLTRDRDLLSLMESVFQEDFDSSYLESTLSILHSKSSLEDLLNYIWADTDEQREDIIANIFSRIGASRSTDSTPPSRVQIMSMHGAKGLSATIVFIPGLEEAFLPGNRRNSYPSLILEAARMLYVSITRGRIACIISRAERRFLNGTSINSSPSRFCSHLADTFESRNLALTAEEIQFILSQDTARKTMFLTPSH